MNVELKRLAHLLNDMQQISLEHPEIAVDFDLVLLLCEMVSWLRRHIAKSICLEVIAEQSIWVLLPENTLRYAMLNLVFNAVEAVAHKKSGHISIAVFKHKTGAIIQVFDNGAGFSEDFLAAFSMPSSEALSSGLKVVERLVNSLGGHLKLGNHFPHGACVAILLPEFVLLKNLIE